MSESQASDTAERLGYARALLAKGHTPCNKGNGAAYMTCGLLREHEPPCVARPTSAPAPHPQPPPEI